MKAILDALHAGPLTRSALAKAVGGRRKVALDAIRGMLEAGELAEVDGLISLPQVSDRIPLPAAEDVRTDTRPSVLGPVLFEVIDPTAYLRFPGKPPDNVREWLLARKWYFRAKTCVWNAPAYDWPEARAFLEAKGYEARADTLDVPRPARRRAEELEHATAVAAQPGVAAAGATGLAAFDWSGFPAWASANVVIKDKQSGLLVPFIMNDMQQRAFDRWWAQWKRTGRVRVNELKHRQPGISTLAQVLFLFLTHSVPNVEARVMAHRVDSADAVFRRTKLADARLPVQRAKKRNNKKEIEYEAPHGSAIRVAVAEEGGFGRGDTCALDHNSELAHWGASGGDVLSNLEISVPDAPGTIIINESTAKGVTGPFYEKWTAAEAGRSDYENHFTGWLEDPTCRLKGVPLDDPRWASCPVEWLEDEDRLRSLGADDEQLAWRRRAIPDRCQGSPDIFRQEYPATAAEAFLATGSNVFPLSIVDPALKATTEQERMAPAPRFRISLDAKDPATADGKFERLEPDARGLLRVWKMPVKGEPYLIAGDVGRGMNVSGDTGDPSKLDYTTFQVIPEWPDAEGRHEVVAVWHGRLDPDLAAFQMAFLGRLYNDALLIPEANHYGVMVTNYLLKLHRYQRVFRKEGLDEPTRLPVQQEPDAHYMKYGWWTGPGSGITKARMIQYLNEFVRDRELVIHEPEAWGEMRTYMRAADGTTDAETGKHDDRVMALAIAASVLRLHPKLRPIPKPVIQPPRVVGTEEDTRVEIDPAYFREKIKERKKKENRGKAEDFT